MIKLIALLIAVRISKQVKDRYNKSCESCGAELDLEDFYFNNSCEYCGSSQGYEKEVYQNAK